MYLYFLTEFLVYVHAIKFIDTIWLKFVDAMKQNQKGKLDN